MSNNTNVAPNITDTDNSSSLLVNPSSPVAPV